MQRRTFRTRRGAPIVGLALVLTGTPHAQASPPENSPDIATTPAPAPPAVQAPRRTTEPTGTGATPDTATLTPPPPRPGPDAVDDGLSLLGRSLWSGLMQRRITLRLGEGGSVSGVLISQSDTQLGLAEELEGRLVSVEKSEIRGIEVASRPEVPTTGDGTGLLVGGGLLLGLGIPTTIAGLTFTFIFPYAGLFYIPGPIAVGAGIPMVVIGHRRKKDHRAALRRARLGHITPQLQVGRQGGTAGVRWRF